MQLGLDTYEVRARLAPAVITVLPVALTLYVWFYEAEIGWNVIGRLAITAVIGLALARLLSQVARSVGKRNERALWERWGGSPTLQLLRHASSLLSPITRARYHMLLGARVGLDVLPTPETELQDPTSADDTYQSFIDYLLNATRDVKRFRLVFAENMNYGFHRNLWGLKPLGVTVALVGTLLTAALAIADWNQSRVLEAVPTIAAVINALLLLCWTGVVNEDWVKVPAFAYARVLLAACDDLPTRSESPLSEHGV